MAAALFFPPQLRMLGHLILEYDFSFIRVVGFLVHPMLGVSTYLKIGALGGLMGHCVIGRHHSV